MASVWRIVSLFFVIAFAVARINAAALQTSETVDLVGTPNKEIDAATYNPIEPGHVTLQESKVVFDLDTPQQSYESTPSVSPKEETDKNVATEAVNTLQLIPPASVNASIKQLEKESKQNQGQIIIRYAFSSNLNFIFSPSVT